MKSISAGSLSHSNRFQCGNYSALCALMYKNWIMKKRHHFATLSEILNPLFCILIFASLKSFQPDVNISSGWATNTINTTSNVPNAGAQYTLYDKFDALEDLNSSLSNFGMSLNSSAIEFNLSSALTTMSLLSLTKGLKFPRFYFTEGTMAGLMLNLVLQSLAESDNLEGLTEDELISCFLQFGMWGYTSLDTDSLHQVPIACQNRVIPYKIAITPDTVYTRKYFATVLDEWYPRLPLLAPVLGLSPLIISSFADSRVFFDNETMLEAYLGSEDYGMDLEHPKIYAAIAFQEFPSEEEIGNINGHSIEFSLRLNSTTADSSFPNNVPRTLRERFNEDQYLKAVQAGYTLTYSTRGFMTLQTMVMRVLNCLPSWNATSQEVNADNCQLKNATMKADTTSDHRLLQQVAEDLVVESLLSALESVRNYFTTMETPPASFESYIGMVKSLKLTIEDMPAASKETLLRVLRIAPQAYDEAGSFMSPIVGYHYAGYYAKIIVVLPVGFILSSLYGVSRVIVVFVMEKETRAREFMRILGLREQQIIYTWFLTYLPLLLVSCALQSWAASILLFPHASFNLLFQFFFTFALSCFGYGFLISTLFNRVKAASLIGMGGFFLLFTVSYTFSEHTNESMRTLACVLSPVAFAQGISIIAELEAVGIGLDRKNANDLVNNFRFNTAVWMQSVDFVIYIAMGWYMDKVMPRQYGVSLPFYFLFTSAYWRSDEIPSENKIWDIDSEVCKLQCEVTDGNEVCEAVGRELKLQERNNRAVVISKLCKTFPTPDGVKIAIKNLNLTLYEGHITCLLGHNGAGKTTLMGILTGMIAPSSGNAIIRGLSIHTDIRAIRQSLGYCPQFSVVYPELTVEEHLRFYGRVKGFITTLSLQEEVNNKLSEVGLLCKRHIQAHALSGGMQRKLSLAIAFLGDSQVVFLDEPTSGMDPYSRRSIWELIQRNKVGRVVILTTHFMDEADLLGDRIAILADGELCCVGTSLFLKQRFGVGYCLRLVLHPSQELHRMNIRNLVERHVPHASLASDIGSELAFHLPFQASGAFAGMFDELETRQIELQIEAIAISVTTLEEIFLKVNEKDQKTEATSCSIRRVPSIPPSHTPATWFLLHLRALLVKRILCAKRDRRIVIYSILVPIVILLFGLSALKLSLWVKNDPLLPLNPATQFPEGPLTSIPYACVESNDEWCPQLTSSLFSGGVLTELPVESVVYGNNPSPKVFNLSYSITPNDTTGYCLRFAELSFERGYGLNSTNLLPISPSGGTTQYGGYILHTDALQQMLAYNIMANSSSRHSAPTFKALIDQTIHRFLLQNTSNHINITVNSHPFPISFKSRSIFGAFLSLPAVIFILVAFTFIPANMMTFLVKEKYVEQNARHLQVLSGVSLPAYWTANWLFDVTMYLIPMTVSLVLLQMYGITSSFSTQDSATCVGCTRDVSLAVIILFLLFGGAVTSFTYLLSHVFWDPHACLLYTVMVNFLMGLLVLLLSVCIELVESIRSYNNICLYLWRCSPFFSLANGLLRVVVADITAKFGLSTVTYSAFDPAIAGNEIIYLAVQGPLYFMLAVLIDVMKTDQRSCRMPQKHGVKVQEETTFGINQDEDVQNEAKRVLTTSFSDVDEVIRLKRVQKTYSSGKHAVEDLSFGLQRGDCFGFLGVNGAGKTTTMKMLTGDILPSSGKIEIHGMDFLSQRSQTIGYCPQFDALLDFLTVREHLELFGRLKGFVGSELQEKVNGMLRQFHFEMFQYKLAGNLSGGNKRKLSVAIAMLGEPILLFLDEPSTGMDPVSRRFMWDLLLQVSVESRQSTILLTTHSMEECEALCNRVGIMAGGQLRCFGTLPHLKTRFGEGYLLDCKLKITTPIELELLIQQLTQQNVTISLTKEQIIQVCGFIGASAQQQTDALHLLDANETLDKIDFCRWWSLEQRVKNLTMFLQAAFHDITLTLVERQVDFCRFKLTSTDTRIVINKIYRLSHVFRVIEKALGDLNIQEYSISPTSLEQIFNTFAHLQVNQPQENITE